MDKQENNSSLKNRYDRMEWAGAFGDLGTLIPFVAAYIGVLKLDPFGVLFAFGVSMLVCGFYYKTPFPVQPMKAIGAVAALQAVQTAHVTPGAVYSAALVTGGIWFVLGLTKAASFISKLVPPTVVIGIVWGLGFGFMLEGVRMMHSNWWVAGFSAAFALALMGNKRLPAMFVLLGFGCLVGGLEHPDVLDRLGSISIAFRMPSFAPASISWNEFLIGATLLALPQIPLTLGNAVIAIREENNRLFPQRPVTEARVAVSTGIMNFFSGVVGGVPMCHGAGGMAAHIAFGAKTGGSVIIVGSVLLGLALFFSNSVELLFQLFPAAVLGVILFITGLQLALGNSVLPESRSGRAIVLATAALCLWNVALGFLVGVAFHHLQVHGYLKL